MIVKAVLCRKERWKIKIQRLFWLSELHFSTRLSNSFILLVLEKVMEQDSIGQFQQRWRKTVETKNADSAEVADTPKRMWRRRAAAFAIKGGFASLLNWFYAFLSGRFLSLSMNGGDV